MTTSLTQHTLPRDVERALRRLLRTLRAAPAEIQALGQPTSGIDAETTPAAAIDQISDWLYASWYTALQSADAIPAPVPGRHNLASALRASTAASTRWEAGWVAMRVTPAGICLAGRGNQTRELRPGEYVNMARHGMPIAPGDQIAITELLEWVDQPTGFWCAKSWVGDPQKPLVRVYFSARADQVGYVLMEATKTLDSLKLPYALKCPSVVSSYARVDSLIVYMEAGAWSQAAANITATARRAKAHLRDATPPLTKKIAQGVAFAEDLGNDQSFGQNRCRALAPGVLELLQSQRRSVPSSLETLTQALRSARIDPAQPWLAAGLHE